MPSCVLAADHTRHIWGVRVRLSQSTAQNEFRISYQHKIHEPIRQTDITRQATYQVSCCHHPIIQLHQSAIDRSINIG